MRWSLSVVAFGLVILAGCSGGSSSSSGGSSGGSQPPPTQPPKASAGGPYMGTVGVPVNFSGAGSSDPQGQPLAYAWSFGDSSTATGANPSHVYPQVAGVAVSTYTVGLTVTDTSGLNDQATTTATIQGTPPLSDGGLTGVVATGQKGIAGAHVYLLAANTAGYGQASVSLLNAVETAASDSVGAYVATDSFGNFSMSGDYTCSSGQQLYIYAAGGNSGSGANPALGLLAAIGSCPSSASTVAVRVNEVSTVAAAYALAGFATDATHVSSSGTGLAQMGMANAFANAANLETLATGVARTALPTGNGSVPQAEINTLANVLSACVDLSNPVGSCMLLLSNAISGGLTGNIPADTATAAINIAHNPWANTVSLFLIVANSPPYVPALGAAPNDFTMALSFTGGGLNAPAGIAIDGSGNAWMANANGNSVTELSSSGGILSGSGGYTGGGLTAPSGIAVDDSGNAWIANLNGNSVTELSSSGGVVSGGSGYTGGGLTNPAGIAIDGAGNAWIANTGNGVSELSSSGAVLSGSNGYSGGGLNKPAGIAIDGAGSAWVTNVSGNSVTKLSSSGAILSGANGYASGSLLNPNRIAIDGSGNAWVAINGSSVVELSNSGAVLSGASGYSGGGLGSPQSIAIDGAGNAWIASFSNNCVTELSSTGAVLSGPNGYVEGGLSQVDFIAIDGSGNAWIAHSVSNSVTELVGAATPVVTPIAAGLPVVGSANGSSRLGTEP
jgi:sugar lactone lactonase YvrE